MAEQEHTPGPSPAPARPVRRERGLPIGGLILLGLGIVFLLQTTDVISWSLWTEIWRFWPVILIAVGVNLIFGRRFPVLAGLLVLALLVAAVAGAAVVSGGGGGGRIVESTYRQPLDGIESVDVAMDFGAGRLTVSSLPEGSSDLVEAEFSTRGAQAEVSLSRAGSDAELQISMPNVPFPWFGGRAEWHIALSRVPQMTIDLDGGASDVQMDLRDLRVTLLDISSGAANTEVTLPAAAGNTQVIVSSGASNTELEVPEGVAARIASASGLAAVNVDESRFPRVEGGWQSPDYDTAPNRVTIEIRVGVANVDVR